MITPAGDYGKSIARLVDTFNFRHGLAIPPVVGVARATERRKDVWGFPAAGSRARHHLANRGPFLG